MNLRDLAAYFPANDVQWRVTRKSKDGQKAQVVAYIDARAVMERLDAVCGPENWRDSYSPGPLGGVVCSLSVKIGGDEFGTEWVTKQDGADNTDIEPVKGGISDSFRRAAVKWGIGRYLYDLPSPWVEVDQYGNFKAPALPSWAQPKGDKLTRSTGEIEAEGAASTASGPNAGPTAPSSLPKWTDAAMKRMADLELTPADVAAFMGQPFDWETVQDYCREHDMKPADLLKAAAEAKYATAPA